ncbi:alanine--tRNA ligase [Desulforhopalus singaporensis]|uniref:Alanine--tRNA ligase n=1 Tax=Desulforhopalus singaporensis TaxID=91360 RepID=A0A1H0JR67_9BACT|nr:alanine--tRNA ligase [Desulforhopalus singaporensis]SDO45901.1 alanyl-tRNA synthetase [Desulforhopalus singaporensis]
MKGNEIRSRFLQYFEDKGHTPVDSSSLVPKDDPTLLFTNAGMVQFKTVFMGEDSRDYVRAVTSQRCVRAGGKHNDLENVGYTARHHTFFEMLGNFSFGDYFKEDAIRYAWEFLTKELGIDPANLWVSIFEDDDEAEQLWDKIEDLPKGRIVRMGEKDNFWAMGDTGPCGPCSEIHIDQGPAAATCGRDDCKLGCDCDRYLELWNLVFMQFNKDADGTMTRLPKPSIDTGMGLERVAAVLQGKLNNFESDLFGPILGRLEELSGKKYGEDPKVDVAMRVIADHARATTFLVADGVLPSNEGRGYVLRRIMRRAVRFGKTLGLQKPFLDSVTRVVADEMGGAYPHLADSASLLEKVTNNEEGRFRETLENGLVLLEEEVVRVSGLKDKTIPGSFIFKLYDTFGFPFDIVRDIALEKGIDFDEQGFMDEMANQRDKSRRSRKDEQVKVLGEGVRSLAAEGLKTEFTGYEEVAGKSRLLGLLNEAGERVESLSAGEKGQLFVAKTPFYAESGGQIGDSGEICSAKGRAAVSTTAVQGDGIVLHTAEIVSGSLNQGDTVELAVDEERRRAIAAHHTATHLLHGALREVLGDHVKQAGSLVEPGRLRFDFTHFSQVSVEELDRIEEIVNSRIRTNASVVTRVLDKEDAMNLGAMALFGEKYEDKVRVVSMGDFSLELCGGTHVRASGDLGVFKILSEGGIAAGVRRIEAVAGAPAFVDIQNVFRNQHQMAELLSVNKPDELVTKIQALLVQLKTVEKRVADLSRQLASSDLDSLLAGAVDVAGVRVIGAEIPLDSPKTLREVGDKVRDGMGSGVAVLGGVIGGKAALLAIVSKDLTARIKAGELVNRIAKHVGGKGGGRPDMAQAGGPLADKLGEAMRSVVSEVNEILS